MDDEDLNDLSNDPAHNIDIVEQRLGSDINTLQVMPVNQVVSSADTVTEDA